MDRKEAVLRIKEHMKHHGIGEYPHLKLKEALDMAIAALSQPNEPLTLEQLREMVERMRGEWQSIHGLSEYYCSRCGEEFEIHSYDKEKYQFCPHCMAPMTDEAVQMEMERLEALKDG